MNTEPTTQAAPGTVGKTGVVLTSLDEIWRFAETVMASGMAPKGIANTAAAAVTIQMGMELGLPPMAALQNIAIINGGAAIRGQAMLGVARATGELEEYAEWHEAAGGKLARVPVDFPDDVMAVCRVKRRGHEAVEASFSVADARRAKLWGRKGPWTEYPARMLMARARSFALRDGFGDALRGLLSAEEQQDIPEESGGTKVRTAKVVTAREKSAGPPRGAGKSATTEATIPPRDEMRGAIRATIRTAKMTVQTAQEKYRDAGLLPTGKDMTETTDAELFEIYRRPDVLATAASEGGDK